MRGISRVGPMSPPGLMQDVYEIRSGAVFSQEADGQWIPGDGERIRFKGALLPVTDKELMRDTSGTFTKDQEKIYTNGHALMNGSRVETRDGESYTVIQELGHNTIHQMRRYLVEKKGKAGKR